VGKKKHKGLLGGVAARAIHHPVVQKAIADLAVAAVLAISAKLAESKAASGLSRKAARKIEKAAGVSKGERARKPKASRRGAA
jgi:hypothetical protein